MENKQNSTSGIGKGVRNINHVTHWTSAMVARKKKAISEKNYNPGD